MHGRQTFFKFVQAPTFMKILRTLASMIDLDSLKSSLLGSS